MSKTNANTETRVELSVPRGGEREAPNRVVGSDGAGCLRPRGKTALVPPAVAAEIRRSWRAREALDETRDSLQRVKA